MPMSTEEFIYRCNVVNYVRQLKSASDEGERTLLMTRLAEEAAKARKAGWIPLVA